MRTWVIGLLMMMSALEAQSYSIRLYHDATPNGHIQVDVLDTDDGPSFAFTLCIEQKECTRIGRYNAYNKQHLLDLEHLWRFTGRCVLWAEAAIAVTSTIGIVWYARGHQTFVEAVKVSAGHAPRHSQSVPVSFASETSASQSAIPPRVVASLPQPQGSPEGISESMGYVARFLGWSYGKLAGPAIGYAFWQVKDEVISRFQEVVNLSLRFLSPAEHLRAATLLYDVTHAKCDLHYSTRAHASIIEYLNQYALRDLKHLATKLEDALAITAP